MAILSMTIIFSCTKSTNSSLSTKQKVNNKTVIYLQNAKKGSSKNITGKDVARAAAVDIGSAITVVGTTGWAASFLGPIYVVGVTAVSTLSSYGALGVKLPDEDGISNLGNSRIDLVVKSHINEYEDMGVFHNNGLVELAIYCGATPSSCGIIEKDSVLFSYFSQNTPNYYGGMNPLELSEKFNFYNEFKGLTNKKLVENAYLNNEISENVYAIISNYFDALYTSIDTQDFGNFSISIENDVINSEDLNDIDKKQLLTAMAIGRYSLTYWSYIY